MLKKGLPHRFDVSLDALDVHTKERIRAAAQTCYSDTPPTLEKLLATKNPTIESLYASGHMTTFMHTLLTFRLENLPVGVFTFLLHLYSPYYNTSQRSGRYSKMFDTFDADYVKSYITTYWPKLPKKELKKCLDFCAASKAFYDRNIEPLTLKAMEAIRAERPNRHLSEEKEKEAAKKIAQEQLRVALPVIWPSGGMYSLTLASFLSLYKFAWDPQLVTLTEQMKDVLLEQAPGLAPLFAERTPIEDWAVDFSNDGEPRVFTSPVVQDISVHRGRTIVVPTRQEIHPLNALTMHSKFAPNLETTIKMRTKSSVVTEGQMMRHRSAKQFFHVISINEIYCPPLLLGLEHELLEVIWAYRDLRVPATLRQVLAPYGAAISWSWEMDLNCLLHFLLDRTCWCAQEEAYQIATQIATGIRHDLREINCLPPCMIDGKCGQGDRYCGRDIVGDLEEEAWFPKRKV